MIRTLQILILSAGVTFGGAVLAADPASSDKCGSCHRDIYRMWRDSAHAEATDDPFFFQAYQEIVDDGRKSMARVCLDCHAPMAIVKGDLGLKYGVSREGVACEFCHGLVAVDMTEKGPKHRLDIGNVKRGTIAEADSPAHEVAFSELHKSSKLCAPCHEYVNEDGVSILTTYSEWKDSSAAERGMTCQTCHMAVVAGQVVDPKVARVETAKVNLHEMPGGHSVQQLLKALDIKVRPTRTDDTLTIDVEVTNEGAGHAVPTGMPGRRIVLEIDVDAGDGVDRRDRRVYGKSFKDPRGRTIEHVAGYFGTGALLEADTRIRPDEVRTESFRFPIASDVSAYLTVRLQYEHAPRGADEEMERLTFFTDRKLIKRR